MSFMGNAAAYAQGEMTARHWLHPTYLRSSTGAFGFAAEKSSP